MTTPTEKYPKFYCGLCEIDRYYVGHYSDHLKKVEAATQIDETMSKVKKE